MSIEGPGLWMNPPMGGFGPRSVSAPVRLPAKPHAGLFIWAEHAIVVLLLLMLSTALLGRIGNPNAGTTEPPAWLRTMWLPAYGLMIVLMAARLSKMTSVWLGALLVTPVVGWAYASQIWSLMPEVSSRRGMALILPTMFALYLAARYDWRTFIKIMGIVTLILAVGCLLSAVVTPSFGIHDTIHPGAWRGLFFEKNALGGFGVRGALFCLTLLIFDAKRAWLWLGGALLCALLVVKSTSTTALLEVLIVYAGVIGLAFLRRGPVYAISGLWLAAAALIAVGIVFAVDPDFFFNMVGKDSSLTGRTNIWAAIMRQSALHPWEGYGYGAFWGARNGPAAWVALQADWHVLAADNAWAEILVQLGWVGVILFASTLVFMIPAALWATFRPGPAAYWAPLFLTTLLLNSITESIILKQNDLTWVIYVATLAKLLQSRRAEAALEPPQPQARPAPAYATPEFYFSGYTPPGANVGGRS